MFSAKFKRIYQSLLYYDPISSGLDALLRDIDADQYKKTINGLYLVIYLYTRTGVMAALDKYVGHNRSKRIISKIDSCFHQDIIITARTILYLESNSVPGYSLEECGLCIPNELIPLHESSTSAQITWRIYYESSRKAESITQDQSVDIADIQFWRSMLYYKIPSLQNEDKVATAFLFYMKQDNMLLDKCYSCLNEGDSSMLPKELAKQSGYGLLHYLQYDTFLTEEQGDALGVAIQKLMSFPKDKCKKYKLL